MLKRILAISCLTILTAAGAAFAQQENPSEQGAAAPPMGPPEEMKALGHLVGNWTAVMQMRMAEDAPWIESKGTANYTYTLEGGALMSTFEIPPSDQMPMTFHGMSFETFDRETKQWQMIWVDNMSCRITLFTGTRENGRTVMTGNDMWNGVAMLTRVSTFNEQPTSFDWTMEVSMDKGQTWVMLGKAAYTKEQ